MTAQANNLAQHLVSEALIKAGEEPRAEATVPPAIRRLRAEMPDEQRDTIAAIGELIAGSASFQVITHSRPDGDALGSALALHNFLVEQGKDSRVYTYGPIGDQFDFIPGIDAVATKFDHSFTPDVTIYVDCGDFTRASDEDLRFGKKIVNIDHHMGNPMFGDFNYVDTAASSAGEQVYHLLTMNGGRISRQVGECVYVAIVSDTGNFQYGNTRPQVFEIAAKCCEAGVEPNRVAELLFERRPAESIMLAGRVMSNLRLECNGKLCWGELLQDDYQEAGGEASEPEGLSGDLRGIAGVEMAILFHEMQDGTLRASFRSRGDCDCRAVAVEVGGGGHKNASGVLMRKPYTEARAEILRVARNAFSRKPR